MALKYSGIFWFPEKSTFSTMPGDENTLGENDWKCAYRLVSWLVGGAGKTWRGHQPTNHWLEPVSNQFDHRRRLQTRYIRATDPNQNRVLFQARGRYNLDLPWYQSKTKPSIFCFVQSSYNTPKVGLIETCPHCEPHFFYSEAPQNYWDPKCAKTDAAKGGIYSSLTKPCLTHPAINPNQNQFFCCN